MTADPDAALREARQYVHDVVGDDYVILDAFAQFEKALTFVTVLKAGHRIDEPHDCFTMRCHALGDDVRRLAALPGVSSLREALEACEPHMAYQTGHGPTHDGWLIPDWLMLRLRDALAATASPGPDVQRPCDGCGASHLSLRHFVGCPVGDPHRELTARFWVRYRCVMVGCETVEPHEHGGGQPMREMTTEERAALAADREGAEGWTVKEVKE